MVWRGIILEQRQMLFSIRSDEIKADDKSADAIPKDPYTVCRFPKAGEQWVLVSVIWQQTRTKTEQISATESVSEHYGCWVCTWESRLIP